MKKIKIEILCDEFYVADSLHELASFIENSDLEYNQIGECMGDHYVAGLEEIDC